MGFQKQVNLTPAPAVAGDFASGNYHSSALSVAGGLVAGSTGVTVGKFAWISRADSITTYSRGTVGQKADGFVHRDQQALITNYLGESSMVIPAGFPVTLQNEGDFWAVNAGSSATNINDPLYISYIDGSVANTLQTGASTTGAIGSTFTATGSSTSLTVTSVTGLISIGDTISGTGVPAGTTIVSQTSGTTGGAGVYVTSVATTASAATVTSFGSVLNVTAIASGVLSVGEQITGTGVPTGAVITGQLTGLAGGVGQYTISVPATAYAASTTVTVVAGILHPNWAFKSSAAVGELAKISTLG